MENVMEDGMPDVLIFKTVKTLSDGSKAFNVEIDRIVFAAVTESDANTMADKIRQAILDHSVTSVEILDA